MTSQNKRFIVRHRAFLILLGIYVVVNLLTLTKYPKVTDDEGFYANWAYLLHKNGLPLLDTHVSNNGSFKGLLFFPFSGILFYGSMAVIGHFLEFGLYALRLHSLLFATLSLILTYQIAALLLKDTKKAFYSLFFLAGSTQFLWIAHTIGQASMLISLILGMIFLLIKGLNDSKEIYFFLASFFLGSSITIHPNGILLLPIFLTLFLYSQRKQGKPIWPVLAKMIGFSFLGGLLFLFFDYMPHRDHYWRLFHSPFFDGYTTNRYLYVIKSPLLEIIIFIKNYWLRFWSGQYHWKLFYFAINVTAIVGGFYFRSRTHYFLLLTLLLFHSILLVTHGNESYFSYSMPFFCILFASVVIEASKKIGGLAQKALTKKICSAASFIFLVLYTLHPLITLWSYRDYDYHEQVQKIKSHVDEKENLLASYLYFFDWQKKENLYPHYILMNYSLEKLLAELNIKYFILDHYSNVSFGSLEPNEILEANDSFLSRHCIRILVLRDYRPQWNTPTFSGEETVLFDCSPLPAKEPALSEKKSENALKHYFT